ncbi:hypothetical protein [Flavobacterium poyangense]|uniref:hypothetical protein n=1 Tax=Flavobacterium poyangense TaxID=2204302 RepID=UPI001421E51C|nr:hypothetical protein [Flavobacterium sp. JXAS1]
MEIQHNKSVTEFSELMNKAHYFTKLKREHTTDGSFNVALKVSSYNELNLMVSDLLKASILVLKNDTQSVSNDADINVMTLLEIALQLLPEDEMELLDDLHEVYLQSDATSKLFSKME